MFWRNWRSYSVEYYLNWWTSSNIISTNFRLIPEINYCFFILTRRGKSFPHYFQALSSWQSIPSYKVLFKCFEFSSKRYDPDKVGFFFISESVKHQFTVPNTKKSTHKDKRLNAVLMKKILSTRACYSLSDKKLGTVWHNSKYRKYLHDINLA